MTPQSFAAQHGPNAKVSLDELREELAKIREQGWAMQDEELAYGLRSVAGPIDRRRTAASSPGVNLAVQARDWSNQRIVRELRPAVLGPAQEISALLDRRQRRRMTGARIAKLPAGARSIRERRELYDAIAGRPAQPGPAAVPARRRRRRARGPVQRLPAAARGSGRALQAVGSAVRYQTALSDRAREIAILVVAGHWDSAFEWYAHEAVGRHVGLDRRRAGGGPRPARYDALRRRRARWSPRTTRAARRGGDLDDAAYAAVVDALGEPGLFELLTLVGYYATLALQLRVFRVAAPAVLSTRGLTRRRSLAMIDVKVTFMSESALGKGARMKLVTFDEGRVGRTSTATTVVELDVPSTREYFERPARRVVGETGERLPLADVTLRAPIVPKKFFHTAGNFTDHHEELEAVDWSHPVHKGIVFFQNVDAIIGPDDAIVYPEGLTKELDYELELADRHRQERQVLRAGRGRGLHRRLPGLQRHHRARHPAPRDGVRRLLVLQGDRHLLPDRPVDRHQGRDARPAGAARWSCGSTARSARAATPRRW